MGAIGCRCTDDVDTTVAEATAENDVAPGDEAGMSQVGQES